MLHPHANIIIPKEMIRDAVARGLRINDEIAKKLNHHLTNNICLKLRELCNINNIPDLSIMGVFIWYYTKCHELQQQMDMACSSSIFTHSIFTEIINLNPTVMKPFNEWVINEAKISFKEEECYTLSREKDVLQLQKQDQQQTQITGQT